MVYDMNVLAAQIAMMGDLPGFTAPAGVEVINAVHEVVMTDTFDEPF